MPWLSRRTPAVPLLPEEGVRTPVPRLDWSAAGVGGPPRLLGRALLSWTASLVCSAPAAAVETDAPGPLEVLSLAWGAPPEERPDLLHRPLAGGGFQPTLRPTPAALPHLAGEPLALHTLHHRWNTHVWGLLPPSPATTATVESVTHF